MCRPACPKEKNINGRNKGPSMNEYGCDLFDCKELQITYRKREEKEILNHKYIKYVGEYFLIKKGLLSVPMEVLPNC